MSDKSTKFYHALNIDPAVCGGCTHCVTKCPTGALRIRKGKAVLYRPNWCVDCGECLKVCPSNAISVQQDDFDRIFDFRYRVALVPALFFGQFPETYGEREIFNALFELGFTHIYEVESVVEPVREQMAADIAAAQDKPSISSYCPAIVRLIQIRFPDLVDNILYVKPPIEAAAILYRDKLRGEGFRDEDIGMFYITPCAAKIASLKNEKEYASLINGVLNMNFMFNKVSQILHNKQEEIVRHEDKFVPTLSCSEMSWSLTAGEADGFAGRCFAVDEIHNVTEFIERMEMTGELDNIDFLELRACDRGCVGGALTPANRFLAAERLHKRSLTHPKGTELYENVAPAYLAALRQNIHNEKYPAMTKLIYEGSMKEVLQKMDAAGKLVKYLPGIDCGACGSPGCQSLAEDIVRGEAVFGNCLFMRRENIVSDRAFPKRDSGIIDKIWGEGKIKHENNKNKDNETE